MEKCVLCPSYIDEDEEKVYFYLNQEDEIMSPAHLRCFVQKKFVTTSSFECTPSDIVIISAWEICAWCRRIGVVVARMPRTNQAICNSCNEIIGRLLCQSDAKQIFENATIHSGEKPEVLAIIDPEHKD